HHAHKIGAEDRRDDNGGIARIGKIVHGPGPDLAPLHARFQGAAKQAGAVWCGFARRLGSRLRRPVHDSTAATPARAMAPSSGDLTPDTPMAPTTCPSTTMGTPPSISASMPGTVKKEWRP